MAILRSHGLDGNRVVPRRPIRERASRPSRIARLFRGLGPGLIAGVSDDDPSGIATYSQAGAQAGYGMLWTSVFSLPLMTAVQEMSARIGRTTGQGLAAAMRRQYSGWVLYPIVLVLLVANTLNIGADIGAMGQALTLLVGGPALVYAVFFAIICTLLPVLLSYASYARILKWGTLVLLAYLATPFTTHIPLHRAIRGALVPSLALDKAHLATLVAVLGTTISPYLFFWQAAQETEEIRANDDQQPLRREPRQARHQLSRIRFDTIVGMTVSNLVAFFIILSAAATLQPQGITDIESSTQAAKALEPVAGHLAETLFAIGIIGTGLLSVPVMAASAGYGVADAFGQPSGLGRTPRKAKSFYAVLGAGIALGLLINFPEVERLTGVTPFKALYWAAVANGWAAVPALIMLLLLSGNRSVMGEFTVGRRLRAIGWFTVGLMFLAAIGTVVL